MQPTRHTFRLCLFAASVCASLLASPIQAGICKWVDDDGVTHYAERCPDDVDAREVEIQPPPSEEQMDKAREPSAVLLQPAPSATSRTAGVSGFRSLPLEDLGPWPENTTSLYLETVGADLAYDLDDLEGQFMLALKAGENLPRGAYLEAHFPHPASAGRKTVVDRELRRKEATIRMRSPMSNELKCRNYEIEVFIYRDRSRDELLDIHTQVIQSRVDLSLVSDKMDMASAIAKWGGKCPSAHQREMAQMTVEQLEALCEREREKRLKPEREALIEQCKAETGKSDEQCEKYWADYGDAVRIDRVRVRPALYYDLPECIAAENARQE